MIKFVECLQSMNHAGGGNEAHTVYMPFALIPATSTAAQALHVQTSRFLW